jgi:quercetin dioxygenase-like cupin family protein
MRGTVIQGDPTHGAYVIYAKASAGCEVPAHRHTADGELIWISGTGNFKMKDISDQIVKPGMFSRVPSKRLHFGTLYYRLLILCSGRQGFRHSLRRCQRE